MTTTVLATYIVCELFIALYYNSENINILLCLVQKKAKTNVSNYKAIYFYTLFLLLRLMIRTPNDSIFVNIAILAIWCRKRKKYGPSGVFNLVHNYIS